MEDATVLVCCGGGGLTAGISLALEAEAPGMRVRPVEPEGFDDTAKSLAAGERVGHGQPEVGLADAILTAMPGEITFPTIQRLCGPGIVVTNDEIKSAMRLAALRLKVVVEPGGAGGLGCSALSWRQARPRSDHLHLVRRQCRPGDVCADPGRGLRRYSPGVASAAVAGCT